MLRFVSLAGLLLALALSAPLGPAIARAQDAPLDATRAEALALFRRGIELGEQDRWAEALEHFRRSRELAERPNTVFNIGFALHRLGRFTEAVEAFDGYLALTEGETSERREEAARLRGESVASVAEVELELSPPDARVFVDGEPLEGASGSRRTLVLDPGRHTVRATADGHEEGALTISVLAGERGARSLALAPLEAALDPSSPDGAAVLEDPIFWVITGIVVVGAGVAIGAGVVASQSSELYGGSSGVVLYGLRF